MDANRHGRTIALALITLFGPTMLLPTLAARMTAPIVSIGSVNNVPQEAPKSFAQAVVDVDGY